MYIPQKVRNSGYLDEDFIRSLVSRISVATVARKTCCWIESPDFIVYVLTFHEDTVQD